MRYTVVIQTRLNEDGFPPVFAAEVRRGPAWSKRLDASAFDRDEAYRRLRWEVERRRTQRETFDFVHTPA